MIEVLYLTLDTYIESIRDKKIAVIGIGVSNLPLINLLAEKGCKVTACDKRQQIAETADALEDAGVSLCLGDDYLEHLSHDIIFRTPGLHPDVPQLKNARRAGAVVTSEMELFFKLCPCKIIAVTGSDGKTTTTTIISKLMESAGYNTHLGGNIGTPLLTRLPDIAPCDYAVLELSSFQLHSMYCKPDIAVITNISPNHLDVHPDMADYVRAKTSVFKNQDESCRLVLNMSDSYTPEFTAQAKSQIMLFGTHNIPNNGAGLINGIIHTVENGAVTPLMPADEIRIPGAHNTENYMAAFCAVSGLVSPDVCRQVAKSFGGVAHRLELVRIIHGVSYYNDSIASSPTRTIAGLRSFKDEKIILIAGGYDKNIPFDILGQEIVSRVSALFLVGDTSDKIRSAVLSSKGYNKDTLPIIIAESLKQAIFSASNAAKAGDIVLLSPACASFDQFVNFVQRGDCFKEIVRELE